MMNAIAIGTAGMLAATQRLEASAKRVADLAQQDGSAPNLANEAVEQVAAETSFALNAATVRASAKMAKRIMNNLV